MIRSGHPRAGSFTRRKGEQGYAILLVLFLATLMLIGAMAIAPNVLTEGRREKEKEMIWRGKQYARGVKLYYRKTGKFPTSLDDLTKPKLGSLRFMRQPYKDPMNAKDGEWRLIYVGPTGQLVGSLKPPQTIQMSGLAGTVPGTPAAQLAAQSAGQTSGPGFGQALSQAVNTVFGNGGSSASATGANGAPNATTNTTNGNGSGQQNPAAGATGAVSTDSSGAATGAPDAATQALLDSEPAAVMGGNIIGVGSKINHRSITVYEKAKNYKMFEFIWDPAKDTITIGGTGSQIGQPVGAPLGTPAGQPNSFGPSPNGNPSSPGAPLNPQPGPPENAPAPPPQ
jgi:hypothetical protein